MAIEYDSDDIGELDEDSDNVIQGTVSVYQYDKLLNKFLDDHPTSSHEHEAGFAYHTAASDGNDHLHDKEAVAKVSFTCHHSPSYRQLDVATVLLLHYTLRTCCTCNSQTVCKKDKKSLRCEMFQPCHETWFMGGSE